jgi:hypothetical protein
MFFWTSNLVHICLKHVADANQQKVAGAVAGGNL